MSNNYPVQARLLLDSFPDSDKDREDQILLSTFVNGNVNNSWYFQQDDVTLLVDEKPEHIVIGLGQKENGRAFRGTGKIKSKTIELAYGSGIEFNNTAERNKAKAEALEPMAGKSNNLYEAFVSTFGEDKIIEDNR